MLEMQGHTVSGISLDPEEKSLFNQANLHKIFKHDLRIDIRNREALKSSIEEIDPEVIIHLAAQPLVRESYRIPVETFDINVMGTLNVLEATRDLKNLKAALIITTDKVYKNHNHLRGYVEADELGGDDPYSASKAAADIAAQSWIKSFAKVPIAIARAGNVIGGGDWAKDRIIPDLVNAFANGKLPTLRYPSAVRPWQHVFDCLNGYIHLVEYQLATGIAGEWNFGPDFSVHYTVADLVHQFGKYWHIEELEWQLAQTDNKYEANYLMLNSIKSRENLGWTDLLNFENTIMWTAEWYLEQNSEISREQVSKYLKLSQRNL
jgi:CDP-glucose 4,6-dehydratase